MKNIKFLVGLLTVVAIMTSCAATQGTSDAYLNDPRTQQVGNRLYVEDPYRGTIVLERDPYSGRYYDVTYGSTFGTGLYGGYPYRTYPTRVYRGGGFYRGGTIQQQQGPSRQEVQQNREATRKKVLGN